MFLCYQAVFVLACLVSQGDGSTRTRRRPEAGHQRTEALASVRCHPTSHPTQTPGGVRPAHPQEVKVSTACSGDVCSHSMFAHFPTFFFLPLFNTPLCLCTVRAESWRRFVWIGRIVKAWVWAFEGGWSLAVASTYLRLSKTVKLGMLAFRYVHMVMFCLYYIHNLL